MNFKWLKAKSFLSIGEGGFHIKFDKLSNIVVIKGQNLDISPESSNGAGKSSIFEIVVYALFGKLVKDLAHKEIIHKKTKKNLEVEICFSIGNDEYRVRRCRKPDKLELFKNGEEITLGGMPA